MSLEQNYFTWEDWDREDTLGMRFYDATLIVDWAGYDAGTTFSSIGLNYESGNVTFYQIDGALNHAPVAHFCIGVQVLEALPLD
jgi:hypothetical protein